MPNWCENTLEIYGDEDKMKEFYDFFGGRDKLQDNFCFNNIKTLPQELDGTRSPSNIVSQETYDKYTELEKKHNIKDSQDVVRLHKEGTITEKERDMLWHEGITQEMSDRLKSEYGYDNWYDWQVHHWGTKWDIQCNDATLVDNVLEVSFESAWSPPVEALQYAAERNKFVFS